MRFAPIWPGATPSVTAYGPYLGSANWDEPITADWSVMRRVVELRLPGRPAVGGHSVAGVVTEDDGPVRGRGGIWLDGRWTSIAVGRDGRFSLQHVAPGRHEVSFRSEGMSSTPAQIDVPCPDVELRARRTSGIWLTLATDASPPASVSIVASAESGAQWTKLYTSVEPAAWAGGRAVAAIGSESRNALRYGDVTVRAPGFAPVSRPFPAAAREPYDLGELRLVPIPSVRGRVVDRAGHGVAAAWVRLRDTDSMWFDSGGEAVSGPDGSFELVGLDPGTTRPHVKVRARGYPDIDEDLAGDPVGGSPLVLTLRR